MKYSGYLAAALGVCAIVVVFLLIKTWNFGGELQAANERHDRAAADLQRSANRAEAEVANQKETRPGLGEYMTPIRLDAAKLWFAAKVANWELVEYELDELKETMEGAQTLNRKKEVKISGVLDSVLHT